MNQPLGSSARTKPRRTGVRIWRLNIEYFDRLTGKYGLLPLRDSISWTKVPPRVAEPSP